MRTSRCLKRVDELADGVQNKRQQPRVETSVLGVPDRKDSTKERKRSDQIVLKRI